jgi:hypothetical protein
MLYFIMDDIPCSLGRIFHGVTVLFVGASDAVWFHCLAHVQVRLTGGVDEFKEWIVLRIALFVDQ